MKLTVSLTSVPNESFGGSRPVIVPAVAASRALKNEIDSRLG